MTEGQNKYGEWLRGEIQIYQTYHNHKESMAWTATALVLAASGAFLSAMPRIAVENQCATTVGAVLAFLAIAGFVIMQFDMRWRAADITSGLCAALTKVYKGDTLDSGMSIDDPYGFPNFVAQEKTAAAKLTPRWCKKFYKDRRWWSEIASYVLLLLALVSVLVALWNPPQGEKRKSEITAAELARLSTTVDSLSNDLPLKFAEAEARVRFLIDEHRGEPHNQMQRTAPGKSPHRR